MTINHNHSPLYAVIDLGSNSFHMLIARLVADSVQIVDKVKRKVRLASGLNENNQLSNEAIGRGIECLAFFAERLQDIPAANIRVVATATLRIATNANDFLQQAEQTLAHKINLLSGKQEAEQIYLGVAHTSCSAKQRLVLDIGGASTEIIVGEAFISKKVNSLNLGCVTYKKQFFADQQLNKTNFLNAISAAKTVIKPLIKEYKAIGWQSALSGSGTMQALAEILHAQHKPAVINLSFLHGIMSQLIACKSIDNIDINALASDRKPVLASGVAILIALFESFNIVQLQLSSGAIREGLLYEMLPNMRTITIRQRTINALVTRFHIETQHSKRICKQANALYQQLANTWQLDQDQQNNALQILSASCLLHEIGLLLEYKHHQHHGAYILEHADLPGFDQAERQLLVTLVRLYKGDIDCKLLAKQSAVDQQQAGYLLAILRLAVILCRRRCDDVLPSYQCHISDQANKNEMLLSLPKDWLEQHPLIADELKHENQYLHVIGLSLQINLH
jgi:exopolyphosphatase / guanosine-5'-triphosphate,3'-diphosphate pyrophosphatase